MFFSPGKWMAISSLSLSRSRLCDCPVVSRAGRSVDHVARDGIDPGRKSRTIPRSRVQTEAGKSGASMKNQLLLPVLCLAFAIGISGQTQAQNVPMVITSDYYAQPKVLILHARNNSGRDIIGYTITIRHKNPDGTLDQGGWSASGSDMLYVLISTQMAKDPTASE